MTPHISTTLLRTQSDERLVRLAAGGHERAFEAIVERYRRPLTRFAQRFVGEARAEEVVQSAFLNAWNSLNAGTEVRDLKPWLYRIVNNGAINAMQRSEYSDAPLIEASDYRLGPEAAYEQSEELRLTVDGIADLPERQRAALLAVAVDGRAHADVARDLGVSDAGVRQLVRRARVQLRAAATAITPIPLAVWIAKGGFAGGTTAVGGAAAGGTAAAAGSTAVGGVALTGAVKTGAVVVSIAAVATGGTEIVKKVESGSSSSQSSKIASAQPRDQMLIPGTDPALVVTADGQARVRVLTTPDGDRRVVADNSTPEGPRDGRGEAYLPAQPGQPRQVAGLFIPTMPSPGRGGGGNRGGGTGPKQVASLPGGNPGSGRAPDAVNGLGGTKDEGSRGNRGTSGPTVPSGTRPDGTSARPPSGGGSDRPGSGGSDKPGGGSEKPGGSDRPGGGSSGGENPVSKPGNGGGSQEKPAGGGKPDRAEDRPGRSDDGPASGGNRDANPGSGGPKDVPAGNKGKSDN